MRIALAVLAVALFLSGCSGGSPPAATPSHSASTSSAPPPPPIPRSDTLHMLDAPHMAPLLPSGSSESSAGVSPRQGGGPIAGPRQAGGARWSYAVTTPTNLTGGEAHVWVNVKETLFPTSPPVQTQCNWRLTVELGADTTPLVHCINEPAGPVAAGIKELVFALVLDGSVNMEANETVTVTLDRDMFGASTGSSVDALSGSADHDSRVQLKGLKEPAKPA